MVVSGNALREGNVIFHKGEVWVILKASHTQPGKGGAYMCVVMRNVRTGTKSDERFRAAENVTLVFVEEKEYDFLYQEGQEYVFMNIETYEQISLEPKIFGEAERFLQAGMRVKIALHNGTPISATLPATVVLEVIEADPVVKGQTATSSYKPALLGNGVRISVPSYIEAGVFVVVNTQDGSYVERCKNMEK